MSRGGLQADGGRVAWTESRPDEGGRSGGGGRRPGAATGPPTDRSSRPAAPASAAGSTSTAGERPPWPDGVLYYVDQDDQAWYRLDAGAGAVPRAPRAAGRGRAGGAPRRRPRSPPTVGGWCRWRSGWRPAADATGWWPRPPTARARVGRPGGRRRLRGRAPTVARTGGGWPGAPGTTRTCRGTARVLRVAPLLVGRRPPGGGDPGDRGRGSGCLGGPAPLGGRRRPCSSWTTAPAGGSRTGCPPTCVRCRPPGRPTPCPWWRPGAEYHEPDWVFGQHTFDGAGRRFPGGPAGAGGPGPPGGAATAVGRVRTLRGWVVDRGRPALRQPGRRGQPRRRRRRWSWARPPTEAQVVLHVDPVGGPVPPGA